MDRVILIWDFVQGLGMRGWVCASRLLFAYFLGSGTVHWDPGMHMDFGHRHIQGCDRDCAITGKEAMHLFGMFFSKARPSVFLFKMVSGEVTGKQTIDGHVMDGRLWDLGHWNKG